VEAGHRKHLARALQHRVAMMHAGLLRVAADGQAAVEASLPELREP
jgi:hypothetical protein